MKYYAIILFYTFIILSSGIITAQTVVTTTGANANNSSGSVSFTVGQLVVSTLKNSEGTIIHGVQQPYEISVVTGIETQEIKLLFNIFPTPTSDILTLKTDENDTEGLSYRLFNAAGVMLEAKKVTGNETHISMGRYSSGIYYLKITEKNLEIKTFKIIKN
jgi:hypothetical protein